MKKPRISFVSPNLYPIFSGINEFKGAGGAEVQQSEIITLLTELGYPVSIVSGSYGKISKDFVRGVQVDMLPEAGTRGIKGIRFISPRLTDYIPVLKSQSPDIIYTRCAGAAVAPCAYYANRYGAKLIYHGANDLEFGIDRIPGVSKRDTILFRWGLRRAHKIVVQNIHQQITLRENWGQDGIIVANSMRDTEARPGNFLGNILFVGTIKPVKRPEIFVNLAKQMPLRKFVVIGGQGGGPDGEAYYRKIKSSCDSLPNIDFVGGVPFNQVGRFFDGASLLVNTSENEGFPNTFLQAWLRGIPTLSFVNPKDSDGFGGTQVASSVGDMLNQATRLTTSEPEWREASLKGIAQFERNHTSAVAAAKYDEIMCSLRRID